MPTFDRRRLLLAAAAGLAAPAFARAAVKAPPAPVARVQVVTDTYFGETIRDPYRWMENDKDPDWLPFLKGQNAHARAYLDAIPGRDRLLARIQQLSGDVALTNRVQSAGEARDAAVFSGRISGVPVGQFIIMYVSSTYRLGVLVQAPAALFQDRQFQAEMTTFITSGVVLP